MAVLYGRRERSERASEAARLSVARDRKLGVTMKMTTLLKSRRPYEEKCPDMAPAMPPREITGRRHGSDRRKLRESVNLSAGRPNEIDRGLDERGNMPSLAVISAGKHAVFPHGMARCRTYQHISEIVARVETGV